MGAVTGGPPLCGVRLVLSSGGESNCTYPEGHQPPHGLAGVSVVQPMSDARLERLRSVIRFRECVDEIDRLRAELARVSSDAGLCPGAINPAHVERAKHAGASYDRWPTCDRCGYQPLDSWSPKQAITMPHRASYQS